MSLEEGYQAARLIALSMLGSLKRELGDLDRVTAWLKSPWNGSFSIWLYQSTCRDQWFLRPDNRIVRKRGRSACPLGSWHG